MQWTVAMAGGVGIGLVCGWLGGMLAGTGRRTLRNSLVLSLSMAAVAIWILVLAPWQAVLFFLGSSGVTFLFHLRWRRELRNRAPVGPGAKEESYA